MIPTNKKRRKSQNSNYASLQRFRKYYLFRIRLDTSRETLAHRSNTIRLGVFFSEISHHYTRYRHSFRYQL